ncbi:hypothetical protein Scep_029872 [Stephania cephalantha]|uniref:Uncharacterized protein n=1 Tax=Stephania cephalantha TaxID=152367 RepID=A0AAP0HGD4_9MAGN
MKSSVIESLIEFLFVSFGEELRSRHDDGCSRELQGDVAAMLWLLLNWRNHRASCSVKLFVFRLGRREREVVDDGRRPKPKDGQDATTSCSTLGLPMGAGPRHLCANNAPSALSRRRHCAGAFLLVLAEGGQLPVVVLLLGGGASATPAQLKQLGGNVDKILMDVLYLMQKEQRMRLSSQTLPSTELESPKPLEPFEEPQPDYYDSMLKQLTP